MHSDIIKHLHEQEYSEGMHVDIGRVPVMTDNSVLPSIIKEFFV